MLQAQALTALPDSIDELTRINLQDMIDNLGLGRLPQARAVAGRLFHAPAQLLARQVVDLDRRIGEVGLQPAAGERLRDYIGSLQVAGVENVPEQGGVVIASNHPGMTDTLACFTAIPRQDLRVVSADRPFLRALPNLSRRMVYVRAEPGERLAVVRQVARLLQRGEAVMINPAGQIEPDPAVMAGAIDSLATWSESLGVFVRLAPESVIVPTVVSGVIYGPSLHSPVTWLRRRQRDRERAAATWQALLMSLGWIRSSLKVRVEFGRPLPAAELISLGDPAAITAAITAAVREMLSDGRQIPVSQED